MKKVYILTLVLVSTITFNAFAQTSYKFLDPTTLADLTGDTITVSGLPTDDPIEGEALVVNTSGSSKQTNMYRIYLQQPNGTTASFCWGTTCYPSFVDTSTTPEVIGANDTTYSFKADGHPNLVSGILIARYCVYDINNPSDNACLTVRFLIGTTSVEENTNTFSLSGVYPNPAKDFINFNYELNSKANAEIQIFDLTGKKVKTITIDPNNSHLKSDVSSLTSGVYFYTLYLNGKSVLTKRLVISK